MKITGIITEYNPFHKGHQYHLQKTKEETNADYMIVVMSGSFVQRGEPAVTDKWTRTKMALQNGADMVIELPALYSTASAEYFAKGAVKLLEDTKIVDTLCFGSESGNLKSLKNISDLLTNETKEFSRLLKEQLALGVAYPMARADVLSKLTNMSTELLSSPNNILAIEYLKALSFFESTMTPITIRREGGQYHSDDIRQEFASASAIRKAIAENETEAFSAQIPQNCLESFLRTIALGSAPITSQHLAPMLNYRLRTMNLKQISQIAEVTEGLENRIQRAIDANYEWDDILSFIKTKRYTAAKIQRILLHIVLNIKTDTLSYYNAKGYCPYIRVLGFCKKSEALLSSLTESAAVPVLTNLKKAAQLLTPDGLNLLDMEVRATDLYYMAAPNPAYRTPNKDFTTPLVIE